MSHPFDVSTSIRSLRTGELPFRAAATGARAWDTTIDEAWFQPERPNGGYLGALLLRGMAAVTAGGLRSVRSLSMHRVMAAAPGRARLYAVNEREGGRITTITGSLEQGDRPIAVAVATFFDPADGPSYDAAPAPPTSADGANEAAPTPLPHYEVTPIEIDDLEAAWIRLSDGDPRPVDPLALSAFATAWTPTPRGQTGIEPADTVALTIDYAFGPSAPNGDRCLAVFRLRSAGDGIFNEHGKLWSADGRLLAHTRQLGLLRPA